MENKETLQDIAEWEKDQVNDHYGVIIDALAEVGYLIGYIRKGTKLTDAELLESQTIISEPLILYRQLLEQLVNLLEEIDSLKND